ncbi:hypothetical protein GLYMA_14G112351v4 [Glycine max]|nr:hypothetical protein GLYMA_14G112351v4 [Glycine max]
MLCCILIDMNMPWKKDFSSDDMPLLHTITKILGPSFWSNAIVVLTHAASSSSYSYDLFVTLGSHVVHETIRRAVGDNKDLRNPVVLVENNMRVLPNGQVWRPNLLLVCFGSKILAETKALLFEDSRPRPTKKPSLPFLLSSLLKIRPQLKSSSAKDLTSLTTP